MMIRRAWPPGIAGMGLVPKPIFRRPGQHQQIRTVYVGDASREAPIGLVRQPGRS
jgi:hypothetical protein